MATNVDSVRLLIPDLGASPALTNQQITDLLALSGDKVFLAAALALEVIATDEALVYKIVSTDDMSVNGVTGAQLLLTRAKQLRADQDRADLTAAPEDAFQLVFPTQLADTEPTVAEAAAWPLW